MVTGQARQAFGMDGALPPTDARDTAASDPSLPPPGVPGPRGPPFLQQASLAAWQAVQGRRAGRQASRQAITKREQGPEEQP